jgi:hypothetical protein
LELAIENREPGAPAPGAAGRIAVADSGVRWMQGWYLLGVDGRQRGALTPVPPD